MTTIRTLDITGDTAITFDESAATAEERSRAMAMFEDWMAKKRFAFQTKRPSGAPDEQIKSFTQIESGAEVILAPTIVAG